MGWLDDLIMADSQNRAAAKQQKADEQAANKKAEEANPTGKTIVQKEAANTQRLEKAREERDEKEKATDGQKLVIDGAKLECKLCTNPQGTLKVNFNTPTTQDKKTATIKEKNSQSLVFMGNCKKSPYQATPCVALMNLGEWKDAGTLKVQDQAPLLLKSTIPCNYGGVDIKITDCGQVNEPDSINGKGPAIIVEVKWMDAEMEEEISKAHVGDKVSISAQVRNIEEGQSICLEIEKVNDNGEVERQITLTGSVNEDGFAQLKEKITVEKHKI